MAKEKYGKKGKERDSYANESAGKVKSVGLKGRRKQKDRDGDRKMAAMYGKLDL